MICAKDFVQPTDAQRFKHTVVTVTEKFEQILEEITKIRHTIYEGLLNEDAQCQKWSIQEDIYSIETLINKYSSDKSQNVIQYLFFLKNQLTKFEQLEKKQSIIKKNVPLQQRKYGMNLHLYNQMLKKRQILVKYFNFKEESDQLVYC